MTLTKEKVFVTKSFMPPLNEYMQYVEKVFNNAQLTNGGPLVKELESKLIDYLGIDNIQYVTNGTIALQLALRALDIEEGEVITTPFTYVATTSAILWEKLKPVYVDIEPDKNVKSVTIELIRLTMPKSSTPNIARSSLVAKKPQIIEKHVCT